MLHTKLFVSLVQMCIDGVAILARSMIHWWVPKNTFTGKWLVVMQGMRHGRIVWARERSLSHWCDKGATEGHVMNYRQEYWVKNTLCKVLHPELIRGGVWQRGLSCILCFPDVLLVISVVLGIFQGGRIFSRHFFAKLGWAFAKCLVQLREFIPLRDWVLYLTSSLPAPGRDLMAAIPLPVLGYFINKPRISPTAASYS